MSLNSNTRARLTQQQQDIVKILQGRKDPVGNFAAQQLEWQIENQHPTKVEERIREKLYGGCYGLFPNKVIQALLPQYPEKKLQRVMLEHQKSS